jgi:hypothetical protein
MSGPQLIPRQPDSAAHFPPSRNLRTKGYQGQSRWLVRAAAAGVSELAARISPLARARRSVPTRSRAPEQCCASRRKVNPPGECDCKTTGKSICRTIATKPITAYIAKIRTLARCHLRRQNLCQTSRSWKQDTTRCFRFWRHRKSSAFDVLVPLIASQLARRCKRSAALVMGWASSWRDGSKPSDMMLRVVKHPL